MDEFVNLVFNGYRLKTGYQVENIFISTVTGTSFLLAKDGIEKKFTFRKKEDIKLAIELLLDKGEIFSDESIRDMINGGI